MPGTVIRHISGSASRILAIAADDTPRRTDTSPFASGGRAVVSSAGAAELYTAWHPGVGSAGHTRIEYPTADVAAAATTVGITSASRNADLAATGDITIDIGASLSKTAFPLAGAGVVGSEILSVIVLVNGVPYTRIADASNPADGQFATSDADTIVLGVSTTLKPGAIIDIIVPTAVAQLAGGAFTAGREYEVELRDFVGADVAHVDAYGNPNG
jgi:hypothetical protein